MITQFSGNLSSPVEVGHSFVISGRSVDGASRIDINFAQGKMSGCPVPLHLSIRFHEDIILRNSKIEEDWGDEEREDNLHGLTAPNPIIPGMKIFILNFLFTFIFNLFYYMIKVRHLKFMFSLAMTNFTYLLMKGNTVLMYLEHPWKIFERLQSIRIFNRYQVLIIEELFHHHFLWYCFKKFF